MLTREEHDLIEFMLQQHTEVPERAELLEQLDHLAVSVECTTCPTIIFAGIEPDFRTSPNNAMLRALDAYDKAAAAFEPNGINLILYIVDWKLAELELYRTGSEAIERLPSIESLIVPTG